MPAEVAKKILATGSLTTPEAREGGIALISLASKLSTGRIEATAWYAAIEDADVEDLIFAIGVVSGPAVESARSMVERKLNAEMIEKMRDLEAVTMRLEKRAYFVGAVGVVATIVGTIVAGLSLWKMW